MEWTARTVYAVTGKTHITLAEKRGGDGDKPGGFLGMDRSESSKLWAWYRGGLWAGRGTLEVKMGAPWLCQESTPEKGLQRR